MKASWLVPILLALIPACKGDKKAAPPPPSEAPSQTPTKVKEPAAPIEPKAASISKGRVQGGCRPTRIETETTC